MQAMRWLQDKKAQNGMQFNARMVVQRANYKEMRDFYDLSKGFGCDSVQFQRIVNWGTFTTDQFAQIDVYHKDSDLYADAMAQLKSVSGLPDTEFWHGMPKIS